MVGLLSTPAESVLRAPPGELAFRICGTARDGQIVRIASPKCSIGSSRSCTLRLCAPGVEPFHCVIFRGRHGAVIRNWSNATRINGRAFVDERLDLGDRLSIGPIEMVVVAISPVERWTSDDIVNGSSPIVGAPNDPAALVDERSRLNRVWRRRARSLSRAARQAQDTLSRVQYAAALQTEELQTLRARVAELEQRPATPQGELDRLQTLIAEKTDEVMRLQATRDAEQQASAERSREVQSLLDQWHTERVQAQTELARELAKSEADRAALENDRAILDADRRAWESERDAHDADIELERIDLDDCRAKLVARESELDEREAILAQLEAELSARETEMAAERAAFDEFCRTTREQFDELQSQLDRQGDELRGLQTQLDDQNAAILRRQSEIEAQHTAGERLLDEQRQLLETGRIELAAAELTAREELQCERLAWDEKRRFAEREQESVLADLRRRESDLNAWRRELEAKQASVAEQQCGANGQAADLERRQTEFEAYVASTRQELEQRETAVNSEWQLLEQKAAALAAEHHGEITSDCEAFDIVRSGWECERQQKESEQRAIQAQLEERERRLAEREAELANAGQSTQSLQSELDRLRNELAERTNDLAQRDGALAEQASLIEQRSAELERRADELSQRDAELGRRACELDQRSGEVEGRLVEIDQKSNELGDRSRQLDEQAGRLEQRGYELDQRNHELDQRSGDVEQRSRELDGRIHEHNERENGLRQWQSDLERRREALDHEQREFEQSRSALTQQVEELRARHSQLEQQLAESSGATSAQPSENSPDELQVRIEQLATRESQIDARTNELESRFAELESLTAELESQRQSLDARQCQCDERQQELESRIRELESREREVAAHRQEIESLHGDSESRAREYESRQRELSEQQRQIDERRAELDALCGEIEQRRQTMQADQQDIASREQALAARCAELEARLQAVEAGSGVGDVVEADAADDAGADERTTGQPANAASEPRETEATDDPFARLRSMSLIRGASADDMPRRPMDMGDAFGDGDAADYSPRMMPIDAGDDAFDATPETGDRHARILDSSRGDGVENDADLDEMDDDSDAMGADHSEPEQTSARGGANHENEESVDDYMAKLLNRLRESNPRHVSKPAPEVLEDRSPRPALGIDTLRMTQSDSLSKTQPRVDLTKTDEKFPRPAPPESTGMAALREVANMQARTAINRHSFGKVMGETRVKSSLAAVTTVCGASLFAMSQDTFAVSAGAVALLISIYWLVQSWRLKRRATSKFEARPELSATPATDHAKLDSTISRVADLDNEPPTLTAAISDSQPPDTDTAQAHEAQQDSSF